MKKPFGQSARIYDVLTVFITIGISLILAFIIIFIVSENPGEAMKAFLLGPLSSKNYSLSIITRTSILVFTGLALTVVFRGGMFNMSIEGGVYLGGVAATVAALFLKMPSGIHQVACLLVAAVVGGVFCAIPGILKKKWNTDEFVVSLMMNYVALYLGYFVINQFYLDTSLSRFGSLELPETARLPKLITGTSIHAGVLIMIVVAVIMCFYLLKTRQGYQITMIGINRRFGDYSGMKTGMFIILTQALAGILAGLGGGVEVLGMYDRFQWTALPNYGWDGVIVAMLAKNNPVMVPIAAVFLTYLRVGSDIMATRSDVPAQLNTVIQAIIIMLITSPALIAGLKRRAVVKEAMKDAYS